MMKRAVFPLLLVFLSLSPSTAEEAPLEFTDPQIPAPAPISDEEFETRPKLIIHIDADAKIELEGEKLSSSQMNAVFKAISKIDQETVIIFTGPSSETLIPTGSKLIRASAKWGITEARFRPTAH